MLPALLLAALASPGAGVEVPDPAPQWSAADSGEVTTVPWWQAFHDGALDAVMQQVLGGNLDLASASDRIRQADALAQASLAALLPQLSFDYTISGETDDVRAGRTGFLTTDVLPDFVYSGSGQLSAGVELDLFGRNTLGYQASRGDLAASRADRATLALALATRAAAAWFDHALASSRLQALEAQVQANRDVLELVELRFARSEATAVDVLQQKQNLAATEAQLPLVRMTARLAAQQLAVLTGRPPTEPPGGLPAVLPELPARGGLGTPEDLLEHRPDLRAQAARLTSAWQRRIQRERSFLPKVRFNFNLTGSYSNTQQITFGVAGATVEYGSVYGWTVGGALSWPLFDGGLSIAQLRQARASESAAAHALGQSLLNAQAQVEAALTQEDAQQARLTAVQAQVDAARAAFDTAKARYAQGLSDYTVVLQTLTAWQTAELTLLQVRRDALGARISLHEAVAGPWTQALESDRGTP